MKPERRGGKLAGCIGSGRAGCRAASCGLRSRPATTHGCSPTDAWTSSGTGTTISIAGRRHARAALRRARPVPTMTGLRFAPGYAPRVLGVPGRTSSPTSACRSTRCGRRPGLGASPISSRRARIPARALEAIAFRYVLSRPTTTPRSSNRSSELARAGHNSTTIADRVGLSTRQLQRRSTAAFGYGAKTLSRILRMQRALALVRGGVRPRRFRGPRRLRRSVAPRPRREGDGRRSARSSSSADRRAARTARRDCRRGRARPRSAGPRTRPTARGAPCCPAPIERRVGRVHVGRVVARERERDAMASGRRVSTTASNERMVVLGVERDAQSARRAPPPRAVRRRCRSGCRDRAGGRRPATSAMSDTTTPITSKRGAMARSVRNLRRSRS